MINLLLPVLIASASTGLLDCEAYEYLMGDMKFPDVTPELKQEIVETLKDGTDPACFK
jgi:hypothetical protein